MRGVVAEIKHFMVTEHRFWIRISTKKTSVVHDSTKVLAGDGKSAEYRTLVDSKVVG